MSQLQITCQYMQFGQSACMFHISYGFQCRQDRRYIAVAYNLRFIVFCNLKVYDPYLDLEILTGP
jgi:hypothetical protein